MSRYQLMVRSRPDEPIQEKHDRLMECLAGLGDGWGFKESAKIPTTVKDPGVQPCRIVGLSRCFQGVTCAEVWYQNRKYCPDEASADDCFHIEFDPAKRNYAALFTGLLEELISRFSAYHLKLGDRDLANIDVPRLYGVSPARNVVHRIYPASYWDPTLCQRAFGMSSEEVAQRLTGAVEDVRIVPSGVLVIASSAILTLEETEAIDGRLRPLLS